MWLFLCVITLKQVEMDWFVTRLAGSMVPHWQLQSSNYLFAIFIFFTKYKTYNSQREHNQTSRHLTK